MFHGCYGTATDFAHNYGYNEFAASNDIIMVYPDSVCWSTMEKEDGKDFTKTGKLPMAIMNMVERVTTDDHDDEVAELADFIVEAITDFL